MLGSERLTGALLDRIRQQVHIVEINGENHRLAYFIRRARRTNSPQLSATQRSRLHAFQVRQSPNQAIENLGKD